MKITQDKCNVFKIQMEILLNTCEKYTIKINLE